MWAAAGKKEEAEVTNPWERLKAGLPPPGHTEHPPHPPIFGPKQDKAQKKKEG